MVEDGEMALEKPEVVATVATAMVVKAMADTEAPEVAAMEGVHTADSLEAVATTDSVAVQTVAKASVRAVCLAVAETGKCSVAVVPLEAWVEGRELRR